MFFDKFLPICKNFNQQIDVVLTKKGYINCSFLQIIHYFVIFSRFLLTKRVLWCIIITVLNNIDYLHSFCCLLSFVLHIFIFSFLSYPDGSSGHFFVRDRTGHIAFVTITETLTKRFARQPSDLGRTDAFLSLIWAVTIDLREKQKQIHMRLMTPQIFSKTIDKNHHVVYN